MPPIVLTAIAVIQAAIKYAPQAVELYKKLKEHITALFQKNAITKEQQDKLHAYVDAIAAAAERGEVPPAWQVEPDPESSPAVDEAPPVTGLFKKPGSSN